MFLYGKNSVFERLKADPKSIKKIFLQDGFSHPSIEKLIKSNNISVKQVTQKELFKIKQADSLQGIVAHVQDFKYADFDDLLFGNKKSQLSFIFLDRVFDPQNLGAMVRTAACFGKFAIVIPKHKACEVTETVLHIACGGENFVPIAMVSNLTNALIKAKDEGFWVVGAVVEDAQDLTKTQLPFPLCLVLGSEGKGIRYGLQKYIDIKVRIPMEGAPLSFNIGGACAILCYEITRQSKK